MESQVVSSKQFLIALIELSCLRIMRKIYLRDITNFFEGSMKYLIDDANQLVGLMDAVISRLQMLKKESKEPKLSEAFKHSTKCLVDADRSIRIIRNHLKGKDES